MKNNYLPEYFFKPMLNHFGKQKWWPGDTIDEIIIGAILTQNTNWSNVEKAIENLKAKNLLNLWKIVNIPNIELAELIKPSGYFNIKTKRLKSTAAFFEKYSKKKYSNLIIDNIMEFREKLLSVYGIGKETADSILLYAFNKPVFVVDAYTLRICKRHKIVPENYDYEKTRCFFENNLNKNYKLYNEFHALIVMIGKNYCKPKPNCKECPLKNL